MRTSLFSALLVALVGVLWTGCVVTDATTEGTTPGSGEAHNPDRVDAEDLEGRPIARVEEMLRGQIAGVRVTESGGNLVIRIRGGSSSLYSNSDPLFILDGMPIRPSSTGALTGVNPRDVASIEVLKNASDTAMYGARGANGVILITTKRAGPSSGT
ncbi:MAG: TonB-dependent receptor plug domain-containing protein [Bacteroidota bacterium]